VPETAPRLERARGGREPGPSGRIPKPTNLKAFDAEKQRLKEEALARQPHGFVVTAFDRWLAGSAEALTDSAVEEILGSGDSFSLHLVAGQPMGTSPTVTVTPYHSADRQNWLPWVAAPISGVALDAAAITSLMGTINGSVPPLGFVRFGITLGGTNPSARVALFVTGRRR
jgi:hypothetical protein